MSDDDGLWSEPDQVDAPPPAHAGVTVARADDVLPGLEPDAPADGAVVKAARRTLRALEEAGDLVDRHAVMAAALVTAARSLDKAVAGAKTKEYAVANLTRELRETWTALQPETAEGGDGDDFDLLAGELREAMAAEQRRAASIRDPAES